MGLLAIFAVMIGVSRFIFLWLVAGDSEYSFQGLLPSGCLLFNERVTVAMETLLFPGLRLASPLPQPFRALHCEIDKDGTIPGPP